MKEFKNIIKWVLWIVLFLVPLMPWVVSNQMFFPFVVPKGIYFRVMVEIALGLWLVLTLLDKKYAPKKSALLVCFAVFVLVISLADAFGVDPIKSIRGNYERFEGLIAIVHWFAYFVVLASSFSVKMWMWLAGWSSVVATFLVALPLVIKESGGKVSGSLGNASYLGVYALIHLFIAGYFVMYFWMKRKRTEWDYCAWGWWIVMLPWFLYVMYRSSTLGSFLGLGGGLVVMLIILAIWEREHKILRWTAVGVLSVGVVMGGSLMVYVNMNYEKLTSGEEFEGYNIWRIVAEPINVTAELFKGNTTAAYNFLYGHGKARTVIWTTIAPEGVKERPWLGWGQENFPQVFAKYYNPVIYDQEQWFDRTHNVFFDWLIAGGWLGLLSYLAIFVAALYMLSRKERFVRYELAVWAGLIAAYFIHNVFVFDNLSSYMLMAVALAWIHIKGTKTKDEEGDGVWLKTDIALPVAIAVLVIFVILTYSFNAPVYNGNKNILKAISVSRVQIPEAQHEIMTQNGGWHKLSLEAMSYFKMAIGYKCLEEDKRFRSVTSRALKTICVRFQEGPEIAPYIVSTEEAREQLIQNAASFMQAYYPIEIRQQWFEFATQEYQKQIAIEPFDARNHTIYVNLVASLQLWDAAIEAMHKADEVFSNKPTTLLTLARLYANKFQVTNDRGDLDLARQIAKRVVELVPEWDQAVETVDGLEKMAE